MDKLLPIAEKYGAMFILLPLSDAGLPNDSEEKHAIIRTVMEQAIKIGMSKEDIIVDGLVATIGANPRAAVECYETFSYCKMNLTANGLWTFQYFFWSAGAELCEYGIPYDGDRTWAYNGNRQSVAGIVDECCICIGSASCERRE